MLKEIKPIDIVQKITSGLSLQISKIFLRVQGSISDAFTLKMKL